MIALLSDDLHEKNLQKKHKIMKTANNDGKNASMMPPVKAFMGGCRKRFPDIPHSQKAVSPNP